MTSHPHAQSPAASEKAGALEELLSAEREIGALMEGADAEAERILSAAREESETRLAASRERLAHELTALESSLRAAVAEESRAMVNATRATTEKFDHITDAEVAALADRVLLRLYDVTPGQAERTL